MPNETRSKVKRMTEKTKVRIHNLKSSIKETLYIYIVGVHSNWNGYGNHHVYIEKSI